MPTRTAPDTPRYDASVQRSAKNIYDRDPLLIPQLFEDALPPWYRRPAGIILILLGVLALGAVGFVVFHYGLAGTATRVGRVGAALLRTFARIVA